jgi:glutamine cyclotransferase
MRKNLLLPGFVFFLCATSLFLLQHCKNHDKPGNHSGNGATPPVNPDPPVLSHSIINVFPHDTGSFTQGLTFYKGELYESTGDPENSGKSRLMKIDLKTGNPLQQVYLDKKYFGEGIAILRDTLYQLTWQNHVVFVYTLKDFKKIKEYNLPTEGWGITTDGKNLVVSTGGGELFFYEPSTFRLVSKTSIMEGNSQTFNLNELEFIDGFVYANQWQYPYLLKIDPVAGKVVIKYDLNDMWKRVRAIDPNADVPNGIAYDETTKKIYVTGKYWPELYEIQLSQ